MVLEELVNPFQARKRPLEMFLMGIIYASASIFLANWIFKDQASLVMVFLTTMASIPFIFNTIKDDEASETKMKSKGEILHSHYDTVKIFVFLFLGFVAAYSFWYVILPIGLVQDSFKVQSLTIDSVNTNLVGGFVDFSTFEHIFFNNLKVMIFCVLFAFIYGAGAIFILTWNASVISAAIGNFIRTNLAAYAGSFGFGSVAAYFQIISLGLIRYLLHGIPEVISYFIAGLAGSIISIAMIKEKFGTKEFETILLDASSLIVISILVLVIAGIIEVYVTPRLF